MKNKKQIIKILSIIISFALLISMMINVNATSYEMESEYERVNASSSLEDIKANISTASDVSGPASPINRIVAIVIKTLKIITFIIGIFLLIKGILSIIKKDVKKGVIYILISLVPFFVSIMLDSIYLHDHNITP